MAEARADAALARDREREALERMHVLDDTKNAILSAVSHELRTPLTSVIGFAETLRSRAGTLSESERAEFIERIAHNGARLQRLLGDLLDLDRLKRGIVTVQRRPTDLRRTIASILDEATPRDRTVRSELPALIAWVDGAQVERIIENLVSNAAKHTASTVTIWVRLERTADGILLSVEDDGPGVPDHLKDEIFRAFERGSGSPTLASGTGIGLTLVQRFAELHDGTVWVEDRPGGGAAFKVSLPARVEDVAELVSA